MPRRRPGDAREFSEEDADVVDEVSKEQSVIYWYIDLLIGSPICCIEPTFLIRICVRTVLIAADGRGGPADDGTDNTHEEHQARLG